VIIPVRNTYPNFIEDENRLAAIKTVLVVRAIVVDKWGGVGQHGSHTKSRRCKGVSGKMRKSLWMMLAILVVVGAPTAHADTVTFDTPPGSTTSGGPVDATATFTTGAGTLSITLTNLLANPKDVAQLLSDLEFTLGNGATTGTIASSSGQRLPLVTTDVLHRQHCGYRLEIEQHRWAFNWTYSGRLPDPSI
jgi:hypothetical protein